MSIKILRVAVLASILLLALGLGSCGKVADGDPAVFDSNTNWLLRCRDDEQCNGSLRCYCGICTKPCGSSSECGLLGGAECAESGESLCGDQASAGGLCVLGCKQDVDCGAGFDCKAGQCVPKPCARPNGHDWDMVFQAVASDLALQPVDDTPYLRYFELGTGSLDSDAGDSCGLALSVKRQALSKLLNSLSLEGTLTPPTPIDGDEQRIYRIDLRDYSWDRLIALNGQLYNDAWEALVASDPYALSFTGDDADEAIVATGTTVPLVLVDSFIAAATQPSVYYALLGMDQGLLRDFLGQYLLQGLAIPKDSPTSFEAGFTEGGVEFLAQQWPIATRAGFVWLISEYARMPGALFASPLQDSAGQRELVFTLPNALTAFGFAGPDGQRLDTWTVTRDPQEPDGVARVPRSNLRRHAGKLAIRDELRARVEANPTQFSTFDLEQIRQRFPGADALALQLQNDDATFTRPALNRLGIDPDAPDPILQGFAEFQRPLTLQTAAAELLLTQEDLLGNLSLLDPRLAALNGGTVDRGVFTALYPEIVCTFSAVLNNQPNACP
jgi:hypothetical protein